MYRGYYLLALTIMLGSGLRSLAQEVAIWGRLQDEQHRPLDNATIIISSDSVGLRMLGYTLTQPDGRFHLSLTSLPAAEGWIIVRSLGYMPHRARVALRGLQQGLLFTLREHAQSIGAVYVGGKVPDMVERGDTLVYNPVGYTLGNEASIGDVIRRMPGMRVGRDGSVTYRGKTIEKILINGRDVLASGSIAMNALPPDFAHSIELLKNYTEEDIAHAFRSENRLALNLQSKRKLTLSSTLEAGGGLLGKYEGKATLISLLPSASVTALANANNAGRPVLSMTEYLNRTYELGNGSYSLQISEDEMGMFAAQENEHRRTAGLGSLNAVWSPTKQYRLTSSTLYTLGASGMEQRELRRYRYPDGLREQRGASTRDDRYDFLSQHIKHRWKPSSRFTLDAKTTVDYSRTQAENHQMDSRAADDWQVRETDRAARLDLTQRLDANLLVGRGWIYLKGDGAFRKQRVASAIRTDRPILPFPHRLGEDGVSHLPHGTHVRTMLANAALGTAYPIYRRVYITGELRYAGQDESARLTHPLPGAMCDYARAHAGSVRVGLMRNRGLVQFDAGLALALRAFRSSSPFAPSYRGVKLEPFAGLTFQISSQHELKLRYRRGLQPASRAALAQAYTVEAYNQILDSSILTKPFGQLQELTMTYHLVRFTKQFMMWAEASYTDERDLPLMATSLDGLLIRRRYRDGGWMRTLSAMLSVNQGLGAWPVDVQAFLYYHDKRLNAHRAQQEGRVAYRSYNGRLALLSRFKGFPLNMELAARAQHYRRKFEPDPTGHSALRLEYEAAAHLQIKSFSFSVTGKMDEFRYGDATRRFVDVDCTARQAWGNFTLSLTGNNLLHIRRNEWAEESITDIVETITTYRRLPGYLMLSVAYRL